MSNVYEEYVTEKVRVCVRIRPFLHYENGTQSESPLIVDKEDERKISIGKGVNYYTSYYDKIFFDNSTQEDVYEYIDICKLDSQRGINCTILAYGQTGSGKTYTIFGDKWTSSNGLNDNEYIIKDEYDFVYNKNISYDSSNQGNGIIPRLVYDYFHSSGNDNDSNINISNYDITVSFVQIYNEKVYDLLTDPTVYNDHNSKPKFRIGGKHSYSAITPIKTPHLIIKENKSIGVYIENLTQITLYSYEQCMNLLMLGENNRKKRQTTKNEMSSRSHTVFMLMINSKQPNDNGVYTSSRINICDLAGSEKYDQRFKYNSLHLQEMININKSLSTLGNVINALVNKKNYIPYKDSKLTQLLQNSLGGNTRTILIATVSPLLSSYDETISTLKFADRAHSLFTKLEINTNVAGIKGLTISNVNLDNKNSGIIIDKLTKEVNELKQLLNIRQRNGIVNDIGSDDKRKEIENEIIQLRKENMELRKALNRSKQSSYDKVKDYESEDVLSTLSKARCTEMSRRSKDKGDNNSVLSKSGKNVIYGDGNSIRSMNTSVNRGNVVKKVSNSNNYYKQALMYRSGDYLNNIKLFEQMEKDNNEKMLREIENIKKRNIAKRNKIQYI